MLVSVVIDPSAFDLDYFDSLYRVHAEDLLKGIERNGLLIVDLENILEKELSERIFSIPPQYGQYLQIYFVELLKNRNRRIVECPVSLNNASSASLLDLAYNLKVDTEADALIVGNESLERLKSDHRYSEDVVPLSEYRDSDFEKDRDRYDKQVGPIDTLPKSEVEELIIRSVRFAECLTFYDPYIGGRNICAFREGIEYILCLWYKHGLFSSQQGNGSVRIFTCRDLGIRNQHQKLVEKLKTPLESKFPWPVQFLIKINANPKRIFHARYLETQQVIIQVERGFDLFDRDGEFKVNFFTLTRDESSLLKRYRELPDADL